MHSNPCVPSPRFPRKGTPKLREPVTSPTHKTPPPPGCGGRTSPHTPPLREFPKLEESLPGDRQTATQSPRSHRAPEPIPPSEGPRGGRRSWRVERTSFAVCCSHIVSEYRGEGERVCPACSVPHLILIFGYMDAKAERQLELVRRFGAFGERKGGLSVSTGGGRRGRPSPEGGDSE